MFESREFNVGGDVMFVSILGSEEFDTESENPSPIPEFFMDLNLDQILDAKRIFVFACSDRVFRSIRD